jgi:hypothetical protein
VCTCNDVTDAIYRSAVYCLFAATTLQTGWFFGTRFFMRRRVFMHFIALLASLLLAMYTLYKLIYYFTGIEGYTCEQFKIVTGIAQGQQSYKKLLLLPFALDA